MFGVITLTRRGGLQKDKDAIAKLAIEYPHDAMTQAESFKVEARRGDKTFPMTSIELSQYVGGELSDAYPDIRVDVHNPELLVNIEIRDYAAYVHGASVPGAGGMPLGSNGGWLPALRRHRQPRVHIYDRPPGRKAHPVHFLIPIPPRWQNRRWWN